MATIPVPLDTETVSRGTVDHAGTNALFGQFAVTKFALPPDSNPEINDISILTKFLSLEQVQLNGTKITSLAALQPLHSLYKLEANNNELTEVLDYNTPDGAVEETCWTGGEAYVGPPLIWASLCGNKIFKIRDLSSFTTLSYLDLSRNRIQEITGISSLASLKTLKLIDNNIKSCLGLPPLLEEIDISGNAIESISPLGEIIALRSVRVDRNRINSFSCLCNCPMLIELSARQNWVTSFGQLACLATLELLQKVNFEKNGIEELSHYRSRILLRLPEVTEIDDVAVSVGEKVRARAVVGAELESRKKNHKEHLPMEHFFDAMPPFDESSEPCAVSPRDKINIASAEYMGAIMQEAVKRSD